MFSVSEWWRRGEGTQAGGNSESSVRLVRAMQHRGLAITTTVSLLLTATALEDSQGKLEVFPSDNELVLRNFEDGTYK